ncbi:hypothetical protein KCP73_21420 [Salmonella enterica subsp. enterica]|nr:hypothetical protein KCP73_21420 [Salmonella enterica subsp. enterica]
MGPLLATVGGKGYLYQSEGFSDEGTESAAALSRRWGYNGKSATSFRLSISTGQLLFRQIHCPAVSTKLIEATKIPDAAFSADAHAPTSERLKPIHPLHLERQGKGEQPCR